MIQVGDHRLHLNCTGSGTPTVVLEAGASSFSIDWALVQPAVAAHTRVCSYDRAGLGWSEPTPSLPDPARDAAELHVLLRAAGERPPFVLVGASYGGMLVRLFADAHPSEAAGFVFVDPGHEDQLFTMLDGTPRTIASLSADEFARTLPTGDVDIPSRGPQIGEPFSRLPADLFAARVAIETRTLAAMPARVSAAIAAATAENQWKTFAHLLALTTAQAHPLGDRPTVVLTRSFDSRPGLVAAHRHLAELSTNGTQQTVSGSGHEIHLFNPTAVVAAIDSVIDACSTRSGRAN
jgi:pimeloyl-ACP methyl ester carboxylesterase